MELLFTAVVCAGVGLLLGFSGIAGFLLPLFYVGVLALPVPESLTISFLCFAVAGVISSWNYHRQGNLPMELALPLGIGSIAGAVVGVALNSMIPADVVKLLLNLVVLVSGLSILWRSRPKAGGGEGRMQEERGLPQGNGFYLGLGFLVAVVCALSGAGGPILLMPILVTLGLGVHQAIGVALFDSIFIALPSVAGYALRSSMGEIWPVLAVSCAALAVGVLVGSRSAHRIQQQPLKISVAVFSVAISLYMIAKLFV